MRKPEFDILKGLLIIFVVIGHIVCGESQIHTIIFWFHMPVFLMVSGYFLKDSTTIKPWSKAALSKLFQRYCVPYLSWSILLFIVFHPESIWKNAVRTCWGGQIMPSHTHIHFGTLMHYLYVCFLFLL